MMGNTDYKPIQFDLIRVNRGRSKICRCNPPHYEIDTINRIVMCLDCGSVVDPFDALVSVAKNYEIYQKDIERLKQKTILYAEEANKEFRKMRKNRVFREMESQYRKNMFPHCPECGEPFDPVSIVQWTSVSAVNPRESAEEMKIDK